jgi:integrase
MYGDLKIEALEPVQVENDLIAMERSNSWRNRVTSILGFIYDEAIRNKMIKYKPVMRKFKRKPEHKKDILSGEEIALLFPDDFQALAKIWDRTGEETDEGFMFGTLYALMISTGLRSGEARAIHPEQLIVACDNRISPMLTPEGTENVTSGSAVYGLIIDRMYNSERKIVRHLKKGDEEDPKFRVSIIPDKTIRYIRHWLMIRPMLVPELLFTFRGLRIQGKYLNTRMVDRIKNAGISLENNRILTPHSLRYTYNTRMRRLIPGESLRMMIGHESENMTDYYTRLALEDDFLALNAHSTAINKFWG